MKNALDIHRLLLAHETDHSIVRLRRLIATADELPGALGMSAHHCVAVRVYIAPGQQLALLVRARQTPPLSAVRAVADARDVRPAAPDLVNRATDYAADLVAPLLLPDRVGVFIDGDLVKSVHGGAADGERIVYTPTGESGTALRIAVDDLVRFSGAAAANLATRRMTVPDAPGAVHPPTRLPGTATAAGPRA